MRKTKAISLSGIYPHLVLFYFALHLLVGRTEAPFNCILLLFFSMKSLTKYLSANTFIIIAIFLKAKETIG